MSFETTSPLAAKLRPRTLGDLVGQTHLLGPGSVLNQIAEGSSQLGSVSSVVLWGPPGSGKTTIALAIASTSGRHFIQLNAVTSGVKEVRDAVAEAIRQERDYGRGTLLFIDEIHRFNRAQQDSLLSEVEKGTFLLIAATTENPGISVNGPLLSRCVLLELNPLSHDEMCLVITRAIESSEGYDSRIRISDEVTKALAQNAAGDARRALVNLERLANYMFANKIDEIGLEDALEVIGLASLHYDKNSDIHFDVISAFIKSIRGSDVDASIHYLARMLESGEDVRFIGRRLMISAAEDIGLADPQALVIATSAAQSVALIGMPEARIILGEATAYLALAPKSNAAYLAINKAIEDVKKGKSGEVPIHLRNTHPVSSKEDFYKYPHDDSQGVSQQQYLPSSLKGARYFLPKSFGFEEALVKRWSAIRKLLGRD